MNLRSRYQSTEASQSSDSEGSEGSRSRYLPVVGRRISLPDFRADVGVKYVRVGYRILSRNAIVFATIVGLMATAVQLLRMQPS